MSKTDAILAAGMTGIGRRLTATLRDHEDSQRRFAALGVDSETIELLMDICSRHRRSFDLDKRLAQVIASGTARPHEIAAIIDCGPGVFVDPAGTYVESKLIGSIRWPDLINHMKPGS
jgi:hypothetical protein